MAPTDKEILNRIERQPGRTAGYKQLVKELGLRGGHERRDLDERLKRRHFLIEAALQRANLVLQLRDIALHFLLLTARREAGPGEQQG